MDWSWTPGLYYESPGISPDSPLPPTPEDEPVECDEISWLPRSPHVLQSQPIIEEIGIATTHDYHHALPMPRLAIGEVKNLNSQSYLGLRNVASADMSTSAKVLGKRPVSYSGHSIQPPPQKFIRPSPEDEEPATQAHEVDDSIYGNLHAKVAAMIGKHSCACGKSYTRPFRLRQHIEVQSREPQHPCLVCGQVFGRLDSLRRHEKTTHKGQKIACPGCNKSFRPDYLPNHLRDIQPPTDNFWIPKISETLKQRRFTGTVGQVGSPTEKELPSPEALAKTLLNGKPSPTQPVHRTTREPCDLCGIPLGPSEQELIDHIGKHSLDFRNKAYRCDKCDINFAFQSDLQMHTEAASKSHCGFAFCHGSEKSKNESSLCGGHHPQPVNSMFFDDHKSMEETLWAWENCQLRAHRATIARLLAERIEYTQGARHSIANDEISCITLLTRLSIGSIHSFHSVPAWMEYQDKIEVDDLENDFLGMTLLPNAPEEKDEPQHQFQPRTRARPESTVLGPLQATVDFTMEWKNGQLIPVMKHGLSAQGLNSPTLSSSKNTYLDQLQAARTQGGLKTTASGVRHRARAAALYLLPASLGVQETSQLQYVAATTA